MISIDAKIKGIKYTPFLCRRLNTFSLSNFDEALSKEATFILQIDNKNQIALSWWVSPKRTRSYPYARVYDSLDFTGKKVTIIPIFKDEGQAGDRDFLQWDTISLMSLLGVYVIIGYYSEANPSSKYKMKITEQRFNIPFLREQIQELLSYQSDALHWNLAQIDHVSEIGKKALASYMKISRKLGIEMHSKDSAEKRISELQKGKDTFMKLSRSLAEAAQKRESQTIQPKEYLKGIKGTITIMNYLGGNYYFTVDEVELQNHNVSLIEAKHTREKKLPSLGDIKDGLIKMILFTNLEDVIVENQNLNPIPILKLTTAENFKIENIIHLQKEMFEMLTREARENNFKLLINDKFVV